MALKLDFQYWFDAAGNIVLGGSSLVPCADDDPYRLRKVEEFDSGSLVKHTKPKEKR